MKPTSDILKRIQCNSMLHHDGTYTRLYRYLLRHDIYFAAYKKLYKNKGAATKGIDDDTADGFGSEYVSSIIDELRNLTYTPKPPRRVYIPKRNGKMRPLDIRPSGINSFRRLLGSFLKLSMSLSLATSLMALGRIEAVILRLNKYVLPSEGLSGSLKEISLNVLRTSTISYSLTC